MKNVMNPSAKFGLATVLALLTLLIFGTVSAFAQGPTIFINELHYDNASTDANEGVEIAGPAGTDLTNWSVVFYNGNGGVSYATLNLSGTIPDQQNGFGTLWFAQAGIQNGAPDGLALVDVSSTVIQFLSYEGSFTATDGPANGMTSTDIGVAESSSTLDSESLQLQGTGDTYNDFVWAGPIAHTRDAVNTAQIFQAASSGLTLTKTADPTTVGYHGPVTYTISLFSTAAFSDTGALMTDTLPLSTTFSHWVISPTGTIRNGDAITWTGEITTSDLITFTFVATHAGDYDETVTNTAYVSGTSVTATDEATFTVLSATPDLSVSKTGPNYAIAGETIVYAITARNDGGAEAAGIVLTDTLPFSATYLSDNSGWLTSTIPGGIRWVTSTLASGASHTFNLTATVDISVSNGTVITNDVEISTITPGDPPADNSDQFISTVYAIVPIATARAGSNGDIFAVEGKVIFIPGTYSYNEWGFQDTSGGIAVYYSPRPSLNLGDTVHLLAERAAYNGQAQLVSPLSFANLGSGPDVVPTPYSTADIASGVSEGWLAVITGTVSGLSCPNDRNFTVDDGSGAAAIYVDSDTGVDVCGMGASDGDTLIVTGFSTQYNGNFQIKPRFPADVQRITTAPTISKDAPGQVNPGKSYTYTITLENLMGYSITNVIVTDTVPADVNVLQVLDSGVNNSGVISWSLSSLDYSDTAQFRFVVTPTIAKGIIVNDDYAVVASNYTTPTFGAAVNTVVGSLGIYDVQGDGFVSPYVGKTVTVQGVVFGDMQEGDQLKGFFMQDAVGDGNPATSDGVFVYDTSNTVNNGDWVEVTGEVDEYNQQTQLKNVSALTVISAGNTINATGITLPETTNGDLEVFEGMYVTFPHTFTVQQNYFQGRYGQITLATGGRLYNPTNIYAPGSAEAIALANENALRLLVLDDGSSNQNAYPIPYIGANNTLRAGDVVATNLSGALDEGLINSYDAIDYRLQPFTTTAVSITRVNQRTTAPEDVGGSLKVASFNVLNYFNGDGQGGGFPTSRGADTLAEFNRQRTKIITAILSIDADIIGLMEIENDGYDQYSAIQDLANGLNDIAGDGTYAFVDPGVAQIGTDAIAIGLLYKPAAVDLVGSAAILDSSVDPNFIDDKNRPALAQTFMEKSSGEKLTVAVNHLKSKGSDCNDLGDPDTGDGQGNCNLTRTKAMTAEVSWLAGDPTGSGDPDYLITGDLNAYAMEDPISVAKNAGYTDLLKHFEGDAAYTYVFDGQAGYLDHGLANDTLATQVSGATAWRINADEPSVIDYNTEYKSQDLYAPDAYRASDHDPVIVGLNLYTPPNLSINKTVVSSGEGSGGTMNLPASGVVTYTIILANSGNGDASNVRITDTIPAAVAFDGWVITGTANLPAGNPITWGPRNLAAGEVVTISFRAIITDNSDYAGQTISNTASFSADGVAPGSDEAAFTIKALYTIYLPVVMKN